MSDDSPMRDLLDVASKMAALGYDAPFQIEVTAEGWSALEREALRHRRFLSPAGCAALGWPVGEPMPVPFRMETRAGAVHVYPAQQPPLTFICCPSGIYAMDERQGQHEEPREFGPQRLLRWVPPVDHGAHQSAGEWRETSAEERGRVLEDIVDFRQLGREALERRKLERRKRALQQDEG